MNSRVQVPFSRTPCEQRSRIPDLAGSSPITKFAAIIELMRSHVDCALPGRG